MASFFASWFQWLSGFFLSKTAEIAIVGLQASGKTSFVNVIGSGQVKFCSVSWPGALTLHFLVERGRSPNCWIYFQKSERALIWTGIANPSWQVRKGNVTLKIWDVAGQPKFRTMWERYCHGADAIVFILDSADPEKFNTARFELHQLLSQPALTGVPLLVLGNKNDLEGHVPVKDLIRDLQLDKITDRPVSCYSCSMKSQHNLDIVLQWLAGRSH
ncbi:P-loop containing nucleoside triphosphate hydrolase protein [Mycena haematopus]|nr:P-loop containing nucleoside triphosphate hydrolase protein [Mycena haematopus]